MHGPDNPALGTEELVNTEKIFINMTDLRIPALLFVIPFTEMCSSYLFGNYQDACKFADTASEYIQFQRDTILHPLFNFHESLVRIAMYNKMDRAQKRRILQKIKQNQKNLNKFAHHAPMNFLHKFHLVKAELLRIRGKKDAPDYYDKAIEGAIKNEYINEAALAYELAAMYWIEKGKKNIASTYLHDALKYYAQWGAAGKVSQLKKTYPDLMQEYGFMDLTRAPDTGTTAGRTAATANLDLSTIVKASQALSSEFDLSKLLGKIMKLSLTNAGAQKGCLLLDREEGGLFIEAAGKADGEIRVLQSISIGDSDDLSFSVVNYVYKTRENLVLNDALADEKFANDPYIAHNRSKSILCSPIIHKGRMSGMLYLENNLTTGAFTPERLELLNILSSQAAISIENSRLLAEREKAAKLETEMRIASNIQTSLLPKHPAIEGYDITGYMKPADEVGGDYYDVIYADGKNWLIIGDVSGHGVPSGLVMMMVQTSIHTVVKNMKDLTPSRVVEIANRILYENIRMLGEDKYMSITVFLLEEQGAVHFSGLHQDIMIYRADHQDVELIETDGLWLGIKDNINGILRNDTLQLNPGDAMLIYTDGITEAWKKGSVPDKREGAKDMFGSKRLADTLRKWHSHSTPEIRDGILNELAGYDCIDDVTMLIVRKKQ
jgi:histidine kinase